MLIKQILVILFSVIIFSCSENYNPLSSEHTGIIQNPINFVGSNETLDIITWNIEYFPKNDLTITYVKEAIDSMHVDIIALQEISNSAALEDLNNLLGNNWISFRSGPSHSTYGELSYLINTNVITTYENPYGILYEHAYEFAYREPFILEFKYNDQDFILINIHYKCCGEGVDRRLLANEYLYNYIETNHFNDNVLIVGDFNDEIVDNNNIFEIFLNNNKYLFTDMNIAEGSEQYWSFPNWPSHLDHILISNELFNVQQSTSTILIENSLLEYFYTYEYYISDHRPMGISLELLP